MQDVGNQGMKNRRFEWPAWLGVLLLLMPACLVQASSVISSPDGLSRIWSSRGHAYADVFLEGERLSGTVTLRAQDEDIGTVVDIYLVVMANRGEAEFGFMKTANGWQRWNGTLRALQPYRTKTLEATEDLDVLDAQPLLSGYYRVAAAYGTDDGRLVFASSNLAFRVHDKSSDALLPFASAPALADYLKEGMQQTSTPYYRLTSVTAASEDASASSKAGSSSVSGTNIQEQGVDESDSVKTDGDTLYSLANCDGDICLDIHSLDADAAQAILLNQFPLEATVAPDGMYLVNDTDNSDLLVTIGGRNSFGFWRDVWSWSGSATEITFFDVANPQRPGMLERLTLDGSLVSSRRVGDTLYVVTRFAPHVSDYNILPVDTLDERDKDSNENVLAKAELSDLIPQVADASGNKVDLIQAENCYLPLHAVDEAHNPTIVTISAISVESHSISESHCFLGESETLFMTTNSLYLATTRWDYQDFFADALVYEPAHTTTVHKFALDHGLINYRGSGEVEGHLGWSEDKKSFRMGENGEYLNVVTSLGDTWNGSSSTRLTVLRDSGVEGELSHVSVIDDIGKPGEQLYAARFIDDRAYLVTFRLTDPLYVIDLTDQMHPVVAGELEIDGYSDYLHPISGDLLLGIGKDAIADEGSIDFGGGRGAWYQGLKLSLFNVSDPGNPYEVDSLVLGKRGTESEVLWDHHALAFLPGRGFEPDRLAIPVMLADTPPSWEGWSAGEPSAWYNRTHSGLYTFEISNLGIAQSGRIIEEAAVEEKDVIVLVEADDVVDSGAEEEKPASDEQAEAAEEDNTRLADPDLFFPLYYFYGERAVLKDDAVFYIHDGKVESAFWGEDIIR